MIKTTQKHIAKMARVSAPFISQVLTGKKRPSWKKAKELADATGTDPVVWMEGTPDEIRAAIRKATPST